MNEWKELSNDVGAGMARLNLDTLKRYLDTIRDELEYQEIDLLAGKGKLVRVRVFSRKSDPDQPIAVFPVKHLDDETPDSEADPSITWADLWRVSQERVRAIAIMDRAFDEAEIRRVVRDELRRERVNAQEPRRMIIYTTPRGLDEVTGGIVGLDALGL